MRRLLLVSICFFSSLSAGFVAANETYTIAAKALFSGSALLEINGEREFLKQGKVSKSGIKLIEASSKFAVIEVKGERKKLLLNRSVGAGYKAPSQSEVRLPRASNGHYMTPGRINNRPVHFMVDTGASGIALNSAQAQSLGIDYKKGKKIAVATANGNTPAYALMLNSASVGDIKIQNVEAFVIEGTSPAVILLGNSYLNRVDLSVEQGVMLLKSKF